MLGPLEQLPTWNPTSGVGVQCITFVYYFTKHAEPMPSGIFSFFAEKIEESRALALKLLVCLRNGVRGRLGQGLLKNKLLGPFSPTPIIFLTSYQVGSCC